MTLLVDAEIHIYFPGKRLHFEITETVDASEGLSACTQHMLAAADRAFGPGGRRMLCIFGQDVEQSGGGQAPTRNLSQNFEIDLDDDVFFFSSLWCVGFITGQRPKIFAAVQ